MTTTDAHIYTDLSEPDETITDSSVYDMFSPSTATEAFDFMYGD